MEHPTVSVGTAQEYSQWEARLRQLFADRGYDPEELVRVDARLHYRENRLTLYRLADPGDELSAAETLSHEVLHSLLYQMGEGRAARLIDRVGKPVGHPARTGGI
jgi:hypothetical protein